jgi:homoserine O-acetyltransferase
MNKNITFRNFELTDGTLLPEVKIAYNTYGKLNTDKSNVIWVCHALTGDQNVHDWWNGLFGKNRVLDPEKYFIICANVLGSSYGSTSPWSNETPEGLKGKNFPLITIPDIVQAHQKLADALEIEQIQLLIGPSLGGQQALQWAVNTPYKINHLCVIAANAYHSPWGIGFNESQRLAIEADETFRSNDPDGGKYGLKAARSIALLSYRTKAAYDTTQKESCHHKKEGFFASSYQQYQGEKLVKRFCPYNYYSLTKSMDSHNVGRGFSSIEQALQRIEAKTLVISVDSDILFPVDEQTYIAANIKSASQEIFSSDYGHDGFLVEFEKVNNSIVNWLKEEKSKSNKKACLTTLKV